MRVVAILIYDETNHKLLSEAYRLKVSSFQWLAGYSFRQMGRKLGQDLLTTVKSGEHTIMRSDTFQDFVVHLLVTPVMNSVSTEKTSLLSNANTTSTPLGIVVIMEAHSSIAHPVHLVFQRCLHSSAMLLRSSKYLEQMLDELNEEIEKIREEHENNPLLKVQDDLAELKEMMHGNIQKVIERGETLEEILSKTEQLSVTAAEFKRKSQKLNSCCTIL